MFGTGNELKTTHWLWVDGTQASILNDWCVNDLKFRCGMYQDSCLWFKYYTHKGICIQKNTRDLSGENVQLQKNTQKQIWTEGNAVSPYKAE